jgi:SAM-dependent methyltransferase
MSQFWDHNFSAPGYKYGTAPNAFLVEQAHRLPAGGEVLVPGDGEGRNSVWLALQGFKVTAMDASEVGLRKAQALAAESGVAIQAVLGDLADWAPAAGHFDAVVLTYVHLPEAIRQGAHRRLAAGLRPGGWLMLECFHPDQLPLGSGGPKDVSMLYTPALLSADFSGLLATEMAWDGETVLSEGPGHQGLARVTRWIGRKPL